MRNFLGCTGLLLASVLLALFASELILQLTELGDFSHNRRVLFYSQPSYEYLDNRVVRYLPDTAIRTVAVYGEHIDYDVTNHTNNLGFYDNVDYMNPGMEARSIAFLGDSFTSGSGGNLPWVISLRRSINSEDLKLYNLGVSGTGLHNFAAVLDRYRETLSIDEVNVMAITSDLYRSVWYPLVNDEGVRLCHNLVESEKCKKNGSTDYGTGRDVGHTYRNSLQSKENICRSRR